MRTEGIGGEEGWGESLFKPVLAPCLTASKEACCPLPPLCSASVIAPTDPPGGSSMSAEKLLECSFLPSLCLLTLVDLGYGLCWNMTLSVRHLACSPRDPMSPLIFTHLPTCGASAFPVCWKVSPSSRFWFCYHRTFRQGWAPWASRVTRASRPCRTSRTSWQRWTKGGHWTTRYVG